jgi:hypothetical protein
MQRSFRLWSKPLFRCKFKKPEMRERARRPGDKSGEISLSGKSVSFAFIFSHLFFAFKPLPDFRISNL